MASRIDDKKQPRCSFCNKTQDQVRKLIAGPNAFICDAMRRYLHGDHRR